MPSRWSGGWGCAPRFRHWCPRSCPHVPPAAIGGVGTGWSRNRKVLCGFRGFSGSAWSPWEVYVVPGAGLEPARLAAANFKSAASTVPPSGPRAKVPPCPTRSKPNAPNRARFLERAALPQAGPGVLEASASPRPRPCPKRRARMHSRSRRHSGPSSWTRPGSESNRRTRLCRPLHDHSATRPVTGCMILAPGMAGLHHCRKTKPRQAEVCRNWSGKRDSNSRPRPWQGRALPTELFPQGNAHFTKGGRLVNPLGAGWGWRGIRLRRAPIARRARSYRGAAKLGLLDRSESANAGIRSAASLLHCLSRRPDAGSRGPLGLAAAVIHDGRSYRRERRVRPGYGRA